MGKGIDLKPSGVHIAFSAGTGVLPFLDLVAYLVRLNLGQASDVLSGGRKLNLANFKFVLFTSYPTAEESIGDELCSGLEQLTRIRNGNNFEYIRRISKQAGGTN